MLERPLALIEEGLKDGVFPSAALAIGVHDRLLLMETWGKTSIADNSHEVTTKTYYDMASVTKIIGASMVAFKFIEGGKLRLNDFVRTFFPVPPDKDEMKIIHLMTHTSGLPDHFFLEKCIDDPKDAAKAVLSAPLVHNIGEQTLYSCMGYILLGKILEEIGGQPLDKLVEKYVFEPLSLVNTTYRPHGDNICCTEWNEATNSFLCGVVHDENSRFLNGISANAGIFSTIEDMAVFAEMLACNGRHNGKIYLTPGMLRRATSNHTKGCSQNRGLGFQIAGDEAEFMGDLRHPSSFGHNGFTGTSIMVDPSNGLYVVLLTNRVHPTRENVKLIRFRNLLHNCVYASLERDGYI